MRWALGDRAFDGNPMAPGDHPRAWAAGRPRAGAGRQRTMPAHLLSVGSAGLPFVEDGAHLRTGDPRFIAVIVIVINVRPLQKGTGVEATTSVGLFFITMVG